MGAGEALRDKLRSGNWCRWNASAWRIKMCNLWGRTEEPLCSFLLVSDLMRNSDCRNADGDALLILTYITRCAFSTGYPPLQPATFTHPSDRQEGTAEHSLQISFKTLSGPVKDLEVAFVREEWEVRLQEVGQMWNALSLFWSILLGDGLGKV